MHNIKKCSINPQKCESIMTEKLDEDAWRVYERWTVYLIIIILSCL